jgi:thiamine kinase-like enzyme
VKAWSVVAAVGIVTICLKAAGPVLLGRRRLGSAASRVVALLAPVMLVALVVSQTVGGSVHSSSTRDSAGRSRSRRPSPAGAARGRHGRRGGRHRPASASLGSGFVSYEDVIERIWPGRRPAVEVLGGGITNHNLKVTFDDGSAFVLRIAGNGTDQLGIDRRVEYEASLAAAAVGIGPAVIDFVQPEGFLVTAFIEGRVVPVERMREPATVRRVAASLRAVHQGPPLARRFDPFQIVEDYRSTAFAAGVTLPPAYVRARQIARQIAHSRGPVPERPCHNDLLNANFIDDGVLIRIVDWEYAGNGDVFFDLANFSVNNQLDEAGRRTLLEAYFGAVRPADERALELMRFMSDFREAMWGVVQTAISELEFDFVAYADEHFERLDRTAADPSFQRALAGR